jgi:hypothetical protein
MDENEKKIARRICSQMKNAAQQLRKLRDEECYDL